MSLSTSCIRFGTAFVLAGLMAVPSALKGQSSDDAMQGKRVKIGDHTFVGNPLTGDPLPRTYFSQNLGIGRAVDVEFLPTFVIGEDTIQAISGDLLYALLSMEYQYRVKPWLGAYARVDLVARLGTDAGALLSEGATMLSGLELGWIIRLVENDKIALSATANVWNNSFTGINVFDWVEGIINDERVDLVRNTPSVRGGGGARFAWAPNDLFGVLARTDLSYGESIRRGEDQVMYKLAGAGELNLNDRYSVPLGFALGFELNNAPSDGDDFTQKANRGFFRVAYTGRDDFLIGLDFGLARLIDEAREEGRDTDLTTNNVSFRLRYYF